MLAVRGEPDVVANLLALNCILACSVPDFNADSNGLEVVADLSFIGRPNLCALLILSPPADLKPLLPLVVTVRGPNFSALRCFFSSSEIVLGIPNRSALDFFFIAL